MATLDPACKLHGQASRCVAKFTPATLHISDGGPRETSLQTKGRTTTSDHAIETGTLTLKKKGEGGELNSKKKKGRKTSAV